MRYKRVVEGAKFERCVRKVKRKGNVNPYAVCNASINDNRSLSNPTMKRLIEIVGVPRPTRSTSTKSAVGRQKYMRSRVKMTSAQRAEGLVSAGSNQSTPASEG